MNKCDTQLADKDVDNTKSETVRLVSSFPLILANVVFFLYKTGESMLDATTRPYIIHVVCHQQFPANISVCERLDVFPVLEDKVQSEAGTILIYYRLLINVPAIFLGLSCGAWSDQHGRKIPMMLPSIGSALSVVFYMASVYSTRTSAIVFILVGAFVHGSFGKSSMITMAVNSHCSDVTDNADRTRQLGKLLAMNFFGLSAGALLAGLVQELGDISIVFGIVFVVNIAVILLISTLMKVPAQKSDDQNIHNAQKSDDFDKHNAQKLEDRTNHIMQKSNHHNKYNFGKYSNEHNPRISKDDKMDISQKPEDPTRTLDGYKDSNGAVSSKHLNICHSIRDSFGVLTVYRDNRGRIIVIVLFIVSLSYQICKVGEVDITLLFVTRSPLNWPSTWYAYLNALDLAVMGLCLLIFLPFFSNIVHLSDAAIIMIGLTGKIVRLLWMSFADETWMVYVSVVIGSLSGLIMSTVKSLLSKIVGKDELGKVFSLLASAETLAKFLGTVLFVYLYKVTVNITPGFAYLIESGLYGILLFMVILMFKDLKPSVVKENQQISLEDAIVPNENKMANMAFVPDQMDETE